jgi:hypothetical protein
VAVLGLEKPIFFFKNQSGGFLGFIGFFGFDWIFTQVFFLN